MKNTAFKTFKPDSNVEGVANEDIMDNALDARQLSDSKRYTAIPIVINFEIGADATSGLKIFDANAPFKFEILDVVVQARAASASGTVTVSDGTTDITDAIVAAVDKVVTRAGTIDDAASEIAAGGSLVLTTNGAADRALVTLTVVKK
jgi:hypothetical protein